MPVVLAVMVGVVRVKGPMAPEALVKDTEVEPVMVPVPVMVPAPVAVMVSAVPDMLALRTMPESVPVVIKARVPVAEMVLLRVMAPAPLAWSVRLKLAPVDTPLPVRA